MSNNNYLTRRIQVNSLK